MKPEELNQKPFSVMGIEHLSLPFYTIQKPARGNGCTFTDKLRETTERQARPPSICALWGEESTNLRSITTLNADFWKGAAGRATELARSFIVFWRLNEQTNVSYILFALRGLIRPKICLFTTRIFVFLPRPYHAKIHGVEIGLSRFKVCSIFAPIYIGLLKFTSN
jgi:hypothetical protein